MKLSKGAAYAILATRHIAAQPKGAFVQGKAIALHCRVPTGHLLKILQQLVRAHVLVSERGPSGGFALARYSHEISLLELVESIEGRITAEISIADHVARDSALRDNLLSAIGEVTRQTRARLATISLHDLNGARTSRVNDAAPLALD
ncbi:MAG: Rrf2 family transcriptional regulator [Phycisphaerae bacterium]